MLGFFLLLLAAGSANAQLVIKIGSVNGDKDQNVDVPVRADGFTGLISTQYSIQYDSNVLEIVDIVNRRTDYNVEYSDHRSPGTKTPKGQIGFLWFEQNTIPITIPANSKLFDIRFKLIGKPCDSSNLILANKPTVIEALDANSNPINVTSQSGKAKINGVGCPGGGGGGGNTNFVFVGSQETVNRGSIGCVSISARNFKSIETMQGSIKWDKTIARISDVRNINSGLANFSNIIGGNNLSLNGDSSALGFLWSHPLSRTLTLPDDATLFQVCYTAIGPNGSMTPVSFEDVPTVIEVTDSIGVLPITKVSGKITIVEAPSTITLTTRDTTVIEGQEYCMPILVKDFNCIEAFQFAVKFDATKLRYKRVSGANIPFAPGNISVSNDTIRIQWDHPLGQNSSVADGMALLNLCFDIIGKCVMTTKPTFVDLTNNSPIEFTAGCGKPASPSFLKSEGSITINCPPQGIKVDILSNTAIKCFGDCNGTVTYNVTGGSGSYTFTFLNDATNLPLVPQPTSTTLCAGRYKLKVKDNNSPFDSITSPSFTIGDAIEIIINFSVTHESDVRNDGMITANVTGGCQPYKYRWTRSNVLVDTVNSKISNLRCGNYILVLTDCNGCIARDTTRVKCYTDPPVCDFTLVDSLKCFGDCNARVRANVIGGAIPFRYRWSNGDTTITASNLCAGPVTLTVTDDEGRTCSSTYTVREPSRINIVVNNITPTKTNTGGATTTISGGTQPYSSVWTDSLANIVGANKDLTNVPPGRYTLNVTDINGCTQEIEVIVPRDTTGMGGGGDTLRVRIAIDPRAGGGAISCRGACDGRIIATVTGGKANYTYRWSHNNAVTTPTAINLCPGTYRVTVTDANGNTAVGGPLVINDASDISVNVRKIKCATDNTASDGSFEAIVSGGVAPYTYQWCSGAISPTASNLSAGNCSLMVTDVNGCTKTINFTVCSEEAPAEACFEGRLAISPNNDGANDNLLITCVENYSNTLQIFNRWGKLVYHQVDYLNGWIGEDLDGNSLTEGTYMWVLTVKEPGKNDVIYKGHVTIVR